MNTAEVFGYLGRLQVNGNSVRHYVDLSGLSDFAQDNQETPWWFPAVEAFPSIYVRLIPGGHGSCNGCSVMRNGFHELSRRGQQGTIYAHCNPGIDLKDGEVIDWSRINIVRKKCKINTTGGPCALAQAALGLCGEEGLRERC